MKILNWAMGAAWAWALLATVGCSASVPLGEGRSDDGEAQCELQRTELSWDEPAPNGQVPAQQLAAFLVTDAAAEGTPLAPAGASQPFTVSLRRGAALPSYAVGDGCPSQLRVPVQLAIASDDDATLRGSWEVQLLVERGGDALASQAFAASELSGSFRFPEPNEGATHQPSLSLSLDAQGAATLILGYQIVRSDAESASESAFQRSWQLTWRAAQ